MRKLLIILNSFLINCANSQIDSLADIFINPKPIWSHVAIDNSAIGYKGRTGMDYYLTLAERKLLIQDSFLYIVYNNHFEDLSGCFIEKIELRTGKVIWNNGFDLRNSTKREYTNHFFINSKNQLELLDFRYSFDTVDIFFPNWDSGKLSIRKYDIYSGMEVYKYHSPINDTDYPTFKASFNTYSYLNQNIKHGYDCYTNYINRNIPQFGIAKTRLDTLGKKIDIDGSYDIIGKYKNNNQYEEIPFLLNENFDTIVRMIHTYKTKPYITGDSMELSLYFLDSQLKLLKILKSRILSRN
ncbi:MAG: hypothetical protein IPL31_12795 [Saprospiraceae bacterium]|nr:hypothetical protein [Saprospiraceae bacterium]